MDLVEQIRRLDRSGGVASDGAEVRGKQDFNVSRPVSGPGSRGPILDPFQPVLDVIMEADRFESPYTYRTPISKQGQELVPAENRDLSPGVIDGPGFNDLACWLS